MPARIHLSFLCSGHAFSFAAAKRYFLGSTLRICNLFSLLPFEKLLFNVCCVRCTSGSAADVRTACDPTLKLCWSLVGWSWVGMVAVGYLESRRSPWQEWEGRTNKPFFLGPKVLMFSADFQEACSWVQAAEADGYSFWGCSGRVFLADVGGLCFPEVQGSLGAPGKGSKHIAKSLTVPPCVAGMEIHLPVGNCCSTGKDVWWFLGSIFWHHVSEITFLGRHFIVILRCSWSCSLLP